ncbi:MAG: DEAD/DEAH box helicase family protein [Verrucomicrobiaceae bacterium]|nr:DEAD/DEAH box helicase family protein [Verrucomicrobiaceae bacterium]
MDLFTKWSGLLELPALPERRMKIGGNSIVQQVFGGAKIAARVCASDFKDHDLISLDLPAPFNQILLKYKGAKRVKTNLPVVTSADIADRDELPTSFSLKWQSLGLLAAHAGTPESVRNGWINKFDFRTEDEELGLPGLRTPQIGALHAIAAHFAVGVEFEPSTVVLPTGTGKTETMLAALVYLRLTKALVVVPSDALRGQIANKFISLGVLSQAKVLPPDISRPRVAIISNGIKTIEEARQLVEQSNVLVALPHSLEASAPDAIAYIVQNCSDLIVDEAHHITARTWQKIRDQFLKKRILQFTATPFRRDGKRIDGKIIFNYKLGDAQAAGYYQPIHLKTVEEYGDQGARDFAIATEAVKALRRDRDELKLDHLLMARTWKQQRADEVFQIYQQLAPEYRPVVIYSGPGRQTANKAALSKLLDRGPDGSRIVICVDMLGEGFDLPNLKIAALHDNHKSLAITLQFIGRFTRKGPKNVGEATAIVNVADPDAEDKLRDLYAEGADWDKLIKRLSEERVAKELRLQEVVFGLREQGDLHTHLSLWNLKPALSAQFFKTDCEDWQPLRFTEVLPSKAESWYAYNEAESVLVAVICSSNGISWGNYQNVFDTIYDLLILRWDKQKGMLCLYASDFKRLRSEKMAQIVTGANTSLHAGEPIFNILNNVEMPLVKSLGSSRVGAISFTSYFGPNVTDGLASIEKSESHLSNIACLGYENGERVVWGCAARKGKIWQHKSAPVSEWIEWTNSTWAKVTSRTDNERNITKDFLRPQKISKPHDSFPIAAQWGEQAQTRFNDRQFVVFGQTEVPVFSVDLSISGVASDGRIAIRISSDLLSSEYGLAIDGKLPGGYSHDHLSGPLVRFRFGNNAPIDLPEYLQRDPFIIRYADGTYSYNCYHIPTNLNAGLFDKGRLESWNWGAIDLTRESMHKARDKETIQYFTLQQIEAEHDLIFNDDGSGEAADLVCIKDVDESKIRLTLVHCKGAHEGRVSQDIRNFYTLCGQAQKSIVAKHAGVQSLYFDLKNREERWRREGYSRFLKGDMKDLTFFKEKSRRSALEFEMLLVQPGASIATITDDALRLLATTELYVSKTTQAKIRVIISS